MLAPDHAKRSRTKGMGTMDTVAIILGGADCVYADIELTKNLLSKVIFCDEPGGYPKECLEIVAINDMIEHYEHKINHAVTLHPVKLHRWLAKRRLRHKDTQMTVWAHHKDNNDYKQSRIDYVVQDHWHGSSGLFAVRIMLMLGISKIILCGIPMNNEKHFVRKEDWGHANLFWPAWLQRKGILQNHVRSWSGRTKELLGEPTKEWLYIETAPSIPRYIMQNI